ncbi:MAG: hypothetical protein ABI852_18195, partial [Gemmatimonadaceae bacterium]
IKSGEVQHSLHVLIKQLINQSMQNILKRSVIGILMLLANKATAQQFSTAQKDRIHVPGRIATTVVRSYELYQGQPVVILRRPPNAGGDVIVLSGPTITPEQLSSAAMALTALREATGDVATQRSMISVPESLGASPSEAQVAARVLEKLNQGARSKIAGIGDGQLTTIYLPSKTGRSALKARGRVDFARSAIPPNNFR